MPVFAKPCGDDCHTNVFVSGQQLIHWQDTPLLQFRLDDLQGSVAVTAWLTGVTDMSLLDAQFWYGAIPSKEFEAFAVPAVHVVEIQRCTISA